MSKVPAATRTLALLKLMAELGQPATANRLATKLNIPRSSCYQLLEELEAQGFAIHFEKDRRWGLGLAAWELGSAYKRHEPLERLARPALTKLVDELSKTANVVGHLGVLDGPEVLYLIEQRPIRSLKLVTDVGVRLPAHLTASGRAILAALPAQQLKATFANQQLRLRTGHGPNDFKELSALLEQQRKTNYALEIDEVTMGYASVGVAVMDHLNHPIAGLAITLQTQDLEKLELELLSTRLRNTAEELSGRFGHHG